MAEAPAAVPAEGAAPPAEGEAGAAAPAGNPKKKMLMIVSAGVALVGVLVAVGVFFFMGGDKKAEGGEHAAAEDATHVPEMAVYDVPEFTLNLLSDEGTGPRFLKMRLGLELEKASDSAAMEKLLPRLQDDWGTFLRQLRPTDLQGSAALQRLKEGLLRRAMQSLEPIPVKAVYIRDMLVQ
jgi:flagellar protein FliL